MFVADLMTPEPVFAREDDVVAATDRLLRSHRFHQLPVVDPSNRLVGIVTSRQIACAVGFGADVADPDPRLRVAEIMTSDPLTVSYKAPLDEALGILRQNRFNALPVVRHGELLGIITKHDVLRAFCSVLGLDRPEGAGTRIEFALPSPKDDLAGAFEALRHCDCELISAVVSQMRTDGSEPAVYLRVAVTYAHRAEDHLRRAGLIILAPEHR